MICMGAGTNHWFHSDQIYRAFLSLLLALRLRGRQRRRLGALRGPGEGAAVDRLADASPSPSTGRARRDSRPARRSGISPPTSGATRLHGRRAGLAARPRPVPRQAVRGRQCAGGTARLDAVLSHLQSQPARAGRRGRAGGHRRRPTYVAARAAGRAAALRRRGSRCTGELPARAHRLAGEPAGLLGQGARVLPTPSARRRRTAVRAAGDAAGRAPERGGLARSRRRRASSTCSRPSTSA